MSAGDLGLDPRHVESKLQGILDMCTRWNAILLLDEADVFLEERSLHELERNKLVSIFLRVLEYYEGIMFLTTNRVQTFDQAFQSRIHISLEYKELDQPSRKKVWNNFLEQHNIAQAASRERPPKQLVSAAKSADKSKAKAEVTAEDMEIAKQEHLNRTLPHTMDEKDVNKLARLLMNGRQIKNILKAAQMLATRKGEGLGYQHVEMVMVRILTFPTCISGMPLLQALLRMHLPLMSNVLLIMVSNRMLLSICTRRRWRARGLARASFHDAVSCRFHDRSLEASQGRTCWASAAENGGCSRYTYLARKRVSPSPYRFFRIAPSVGSRHQ